MARILSPSEFRVRQSSRDRQSQFHSMKWANYNQMSTPEKWKRGKLTGNGRREAELDDDDDDDGVGRSEWLASDPSAHHGDLTPAMGGHI